MVDREPNYWQKYGPRGRSPTAGTSRNPTQTPARRLENHQEKYHGTQAKCPSCGRWKYMRVIQDTWTNNLIRKLRLQCECGWVFTHDERIHDHVLERVPGSGVGRRGDYKPRGWTAHRERGKVYRD
jgi:hypothetical protein